MLMTGRRCSLPHHSNCSPTMTALPIDRMDPVSAWALGLDSDRGPALGLELALDSDPALA
jgi:hypothetical protein